MKTLLDILNNGDGGTLCCLIAILAFVGSKMTEGSEATRRWGWRLAAAAFVGYAIYAGYAQQIDDVSGWLHAVLRGLLAAGLALGISWILFPMIAFPFRCVRALAQSMAFHWKATAYKRNTAHQVSHEEALREQAERNEQANREASRRANDSRRREDARMRCFMLHDRHSAALADRFPRERLREYLDRYLADATSPEIVEERGRALIALIEEWVAQDEARKEMTFQSLEELAGFFQKQRDELARLSYDEEIRESLMTNINVQEEHAIRRFLS